MSSPSSPSQANFDNARRRTSTVSSVAQGVVSASQTAASFTEGLVMNRDPHPGFLAATAAVTARAPTPGEIRKGSLGQGGWRSSRSGSGSGSGSRGRKRTESGTGKQSSGSRDGAGAERQVEGFIEPFTPLTEEPARISEEAVEKTSASEQSGESKIEIAEPIPTSSSETGRSDHDRISRINKDQRAFSSGYIPPPKLPWTVSTWIALKGFWRWFITPFGFFVTLYGLNVVAWGGMLFLLLCNASPAMCWAPVPNTENQKHISPAAALDLPGPYYFNCNDINSSRRIWIEIDSQILNALFCVTGFGLVPWRFRDLYYLLRWRLTSAKRHGGESKLHGLRILAGIHKGWLRLPGSETLDTLSTREYLAKQDEKPTTLPDIEASRHDPRIPLPVEKKPEDPATSIRAPPTKLWKLDFFIWCQVWNTFFQCCLCGFMWGLDRYERPPWSTGLFVALACIIAGVGGVVSFVEGKAVKKVEGVVVASAEPDHESIHLDGDGKSGSGN